MIAARRFGRLHPVHTTNFLPHVDAAACNGCGKCVDACPVEAMTLVSANDPQQAPEAAGGARPGHLPRLRRLHGHLSHPTALWLEPRPERVITPVDTLHRTVLMAIERGKLQDCIFDNRALFSHRAMAAILGVILQLPPTKQVLATEQMRSRYLVKLLEHVNP